MSAYYNEIDQFAAAWLRNLIAAGHIAPGEVDERSIVEVQPDDLRGFTQAHFFAGIGVWSYALRLAGWPDSRPVWTGSCPCQPFSSAGKGNEFADERHLWPTWFRLIREQRPDVVFGEQVSSKDALAWIDHVSTDLEAAGYAVGALDTCAAGVGAPHIRQRFFFVADSQCRSSERCGFHMGATQSSAEREAWERERIWDESGAGFAARGDMGDTLRTGSQGRERSSHMELLGGSGPHGSTPTAGFWRDAEWLPCRDGKARPVEPGAFPLVNGTPNRVGRLRGYGNAINAQVAKEFIASFLECRP